MNLQQDFEQALQNMKTELIMDLYRTDVLNKEKMEGLQRECNQRLINVQLDFLNRLAQIHSKVSVRLDAEGTVTSGDVATITVTGLAAGGVTTGLSLITLWTVQSTSWFFWTTTSSMSLAALLAGTLGTSVFVANAVLTGGIGLVAGLAMYWAYYPTWRYRLRKQLLDDFDIKILPRLRDWAVEVALKAHQAQLQEKQ